MDVRRLDQREVGARQDSLGLLQGVHLTSTRLLELQKAGLTVSLGGFLVRQGLGIASTFVCRLLDHVLVLGLVVLLIELHFLDLLFQIGHEHVDHCQHTVALLTLLLVCSKSLRWWRRGTTSLQSCDTSACNATRSFSGGKSASIVQSDALLLGQFALWGSFVLLRVVELVHPILGHAKKLHSSIVGSHVGHVV